MEVVVFPSNTYDIGSKSTDKRIWYKDCVTMVYLSKASCRCSPLKKANGGVR